MSRFGYSYIDIYIREELMKKDIEIARLKKVM